eukprot:TRINITY_DN39291_c0_g1_i1.p1 TRINITY_DN39291_c0_g1~~TRINITY_DN39291_c0_g1_i1.p1  ORF type:complete len:526 (-),score=130.76 TRINITY_DN39291_c0_g1_i1:704-2281(-)
MAAVAIPAESLDPALVLESPRESSEVETPPVPVFQAGYLSIVVLGASGDLAKKKTFPALFNLFRQGFLSEENVHIFGYSRSHMTDDELRERVRKYLKLSKPPPPGTDPIADFLKIITYLSGPYEGRDGYANLQEGMLDYENRFGGAEKGALTRRLFYMALPPSVYPIVAKELHSYCMNARGWTRVVVEKPFGKDLATAEELSGQLGSLFTEEQLYRIDHYLGKEVVQNLLVMRFANRFFVPLWNRDNIDNIQIVFREDFGTEGRGGYFDEFGIVRDIIQNHLLQVLCLVAMEKPISTDPEHVRDEKVKVLKSMQAIRDDEVVLGQYDGYLDDPGVPKDSVTPTFAMIVLRIKNERWDGVPFIMKAGKALNERKAEIRVQFKDVPGDIFGGETKGGRNEFVMRLQPSEAMYMKLTVKKPGLEMAPIVSELDLSYHDRYSGVVIPEAYERLILDTIRGDQQHFVRRDELKAAWEIFTPLLHRIDAGELKPTVYAQGGRGPPQADDLAERMGYVRTPGYIWVPPSLRV